MGPLRFDQGSTVYSDDIFRYLYIKAEGARLYSVLLMF